MGNQIEANPSSAIIFRVPRTLAYGGENVIIFLSEPAEIFLNATEWRLDKLFAGENERLEAASHSSIAV
jgi:hypothetical protein